MIDPKSNIVEHPEVVAQRIETVVAAVGDRERVIAGVDCGFGTFVGWEWVTEDVMWAKLASRPWVARWLGLVVRPRPRRRRFWKSCSSLSLTVGPDPRHEVMRSSPSPR